MHCTNFIKIFYIYGRELNIIISFPILLLKRRQRREASNMHTIYRPKIISCFRLSKTGCNNVVEVTFSTVVNNVEQYCLALIRCNSAKKIQLSVVIRET